ncbi:MAG: GNAT family N-acetyltransferase [Planctomycetaceae bacterium]|nr:GNAT family N-acetyltransferase [Planctomycetaceae bacterium]
MNFAGRIATETDAALLAAMNQKLIRDEGHRNSMSIAELEDRMRTWLVNEYQASIFIVDEETAGYALYKHEPDWTYLRQFFIVPELRRRGFGRAAMRWLIQNQWVNAHRIRLDVLVGNTNGISFWRSVGFQDYFITMEMDILPDDHEGTL